MALWREYGGSCPTTFGKASPAGLLYWLIVAVVVMVITFAVLLTPRSRRRG